MQLGKSLRLRRLYADGRALVGQLDHGREPPVSLVHSFARAKLDAVTVSPGMLERVSDELNGLAVILRLNLPFARAEQLLSVRGALDLGAEAVLLTVAIQDASEVHSLGRVTEEGRRFGMPVIADMIGENIREQVTCASEFGADVIQLTLPGSSKDLRDAVHLAGCAIHVSPPRQEPPVLLRTISGFLDVGVQGITLLPMEEHILKAVQNLVHEGIPLGDVLQLVGTFPPSQRS